MRSSKIQDNTNIRDGGCIFEYVRKCFTVIIRVATKLFIS